MKTWSQYCKYRENTLDDAESINPGNDEIDTLLSRMIGLAWKGHNQTTRAFFNRLSTIDPQIAEDYDKIKQSRDPAAENNPINNHPSSDHERYEKPIADQGEGTDGFN